MDAATRTSDNSSASSEGYNRNNRFSTNRQTEARIKDTLGISSESPLTRRINTRISQSPSNKNNLVTKFLNDLVTEHNSIRVLHLGYSDENLCYANKGKRGASDTFGNESLTQPIQDVWIGVDHSLTVEDPKEHGPYKTIYKQNLSLGVPHEIIKQNEKYNIIIAAGFLEYTNHHLLLFKQINNLLLLGGHFFLSIKSKNDTPRSPQDETKRLYSKDEITTLLNETGYKIVSFIEQNSCINQDYQEEADSYFIVATLKHNKREKCIIS